jgi:hypothetical protein
MFFMSRESVVISADRKGWALIHQGKTLGPYPTEMYALSVAQMWAEGARRQGIILEFDIQSENSSNRKLISDTLVVPDQA